MSYNFLYLLVYFYHGTYIDTQSTTFHCFTLFFGYYQCWNEYGLLDDALVH